MAFSGRFIVLLAAMAAVSSATSVRNLRAHRQGQSSALVSQASQRMGSPWGKELLHSKSVCLQLDLEWGGGFVGASFSVSGEIEIKGAGKSKTVRMSVMIGGGFSVSAIIIKGSAYLEGKIGIEVPIPETVTKVYEAAKYGVTYVYDQFKKRTKLGKMLASGKGWFSSAGSSGIDKLKKFKQDAEVKAPTTGTRYTPWACGLPGRGYGADQSPMFLPEEPSCQLTVGENWLVCPSRSNNFRTCSYYCPASGKTVLASAKAGQKPTAPTETCPVYKAGVCAPKDNKKPDKSDCASIKLRSACTGKSTCKWDHTVGDDMTDIQHQRTTSRAIRMDSRQKLDDFRKAFSEKIKNLEALGKTKCEAKAFAAKPEECRTAFVDEVEKSFRGVYIGKEMLKKDKFFFGDKKTKCSQDVTEPYQNPIRPLICVFMKYGLMYNTNGDDGTKDHKQFRKSVRYMFPALVKQTDDSAPATFNYKESLANAQKLTSAPDMEHVPTEILETLDAVSMLLSMNNNDMVDRIKAYQEDLETTKSAMDEESECKLAKIAGSVTLGLTLGASTVGFCTPDTNPFQFQRSRDFEVAYTWNPTCVPKDPNADKSKKCEAVKTLDRKTCEGVAGVKCVFTGCKSNRGWDGDWANTFTFAASIFLQVHKKKSDKAGADNEITVQLRLPLNTGKSGFTTPTAPPTADPPLEGMMKYVGEAFSVLGWGETNNLEVFEKAVNSLMGKIVDSVKNPGTSEIVQGLGQQMVNVKEMVANIAQKVMEEKLKDMLKTIEGQKETLIGLDLIKEGKKYCIKVVYYAYEWVKLSGSTGVSGGGAITGSDASNTEFGVCYENPGKSAKVSPAI